MQSEMGDVGMTGALGLRRCDHPAPSHEALLQVPRDGNRRGGGPPGLRVAKPS